MKKCNAVFEGGGVRGIGHVGAVCRMEQAGWQFADLAGSSAGAIVAALLAAGYSGRELRKELETLDYMRFKGKDLPDYFHSFTACASSARQMSRRVSSSIVNSISRANS